MILVINAGSSSLKLALFTADLEQLIAGKLTEIGGAGMLVLADRRQQVTTTDHADAVRLLLAALEDAGHKTATLTAAAHRVVHGGTRLTAPVRLTPAVMQEIADCIPLAPLHNPVNLIAIQALTDHMPALPQYASFDTAFHAQLPPVATRYAIPDVHRDAGIMRYGFHGLSYANIVAHFGADIPARLLAFHLGNGASLCALRDGVSVATSMGYSPLSGLTMGTRCGDIDGAAVLRLSQTLGAAETDRMLNKDSGLRALAGDSNMKTLLARDDADARFAVVHFCYWAARHAGSAIVALGGVDAVAFTGGIGENAAPVRDCIMRHLACFGAPPVHVIAADEEKQIARDAAALMQKGL